MEWEILICVCHIFKSVVSYKYAACCACFCVFFPATAVHTSPCQSQTLLQLQRQFLQAS